MATGQGDGCGQPGDNYTCKGCESRKRTPAGRRNETCAAMGAGTALAVSATGLFSGSTCDQGHT